MQRKILLGRSMEEVPVASSAAEEALLIFDLCEVASSSLATAHGHACGDLFYEFCSILFLSNLI